MREFSTIPRIVPPFFDKLELMATQPASQLAVSSSQGLISPVRVFVTVLAVAFTAEFGFMLVFPSLPEVLRSDYIAPLVDASVLVIVLCPAVWFFVVRPLRTLVAERGELLSKTLTIQERERARIARDLHDDVGQAQTAVLLGLSNIKQSQTLEQALERAHSLHVVAASAVDATRRLARGLSTSVLTDFGLTQAADRLCEDFEKASGMKITRTFETRQQRYSQSVEVALYRVLQEALTNAAKHSAAHAVSVTLRESPTSLSLVVADNGQGIESLEAATTSLRAGLGVAGMRERISLIGGSFNLNSIPGEGTMITATVPLESTST